MYEKRISIPLDARGRGESELRQEIASMERFIGCTLRGSTLADGIDFRIINDQGRVFINVRDVKDDYEIVLGTPLRDAMGTVIPGGVVAGAFVSRHPNQSLTIIVNSANSDDIVIATLWIELGAP